MSAFRKLLAGARRLVGTDAEWALEVATMFASHPSNPVAFAEAGRRVAVAAGGRARTLRNAAVLLETRDLPVEQRDRIRQLLDIAQNFSTGWRRPAPAHRSGVSAEREP